MSFSDDELSAPLRTFLLRSFNVFPSLVLSPSFFPPYNTTWQTQIIKNRAETTKATTTKNNFFPYTTHTHTYFHQPFSLSDLPLFNFSLSLSLSLLWVVCLWERHAPAVAAAVHLLLLLPNLSLSHAKIPSHPFLQNRGRNVKKQ